MTFNGFSPEERSWLASQKLGRLATMSPDGVSDWVRSFNLPPA